MVIGASEFSGLGDSVGVGAIEDVSGIAMWSSVVVDSAGSISTKEGVSWLAMY